MKFVLLEMDRILRPNGYAIIRESVYYTDAITTMAKGMKWSCRQEDNEYGVEKEKVLICQKKLWYSKQSSWQTNKQNTINTDKYHGRMAAATIDKRRKVP